MISCLCGISEIQQTREYNEEQADSQIKRTNQWLPEGRVQVGKTGVGEWEMQTIGSKTGSKMYCMIQGT